MLANRIKTDAKIEDIGKVYNFYKKLIKNKKDILEKQIYLKITL